MQCIVYIWCMAAAAGAEPAAVHAANVDRPAAEAWADRLSGFRVQSQVLEAEERLVELEGSSDGTEKRPAVPRLRVPRLEYTLLSESRRAQRRSWGVFQRRISSRSGRRRSSCGVREGTLVVNFPLPFRVVPLPFGAA